MLRRRLNASAAPAATPSAGVAVAPAPATAPTPAPAWAPAPAPPAAATWAPHSAAAPVGGGQFALALPPGLAEIGALTRDPNLAPSGDGGFAPYAFFLTDRSGDLAAVRAKLGNLPQASLVLKAGGDFYSLIGTSLMFLREFVYWAAHDTSYRTLAVWTKPQARGAEHLGQRVQECALTVVLHLPGAAPLAPELVPAVASVTTLRGALTRVPRTHVDAVEATRTPEWARQGANGALVGSGVPERFRVASAVTAGMRPTRDGQNHYVEATAYPATISLPQMAAFGEWSRDGEAQAQLQECLTEWQVRVDALREQAGE